jgi:oxygen-dependent protoporphyrinogen oxidase
MPRVIIIGGGVSGMALAYRLKTGHGVDVTVLEADRRAGGKARTVSEGGFTCEEATNGWLDKEQAMRDLLRDLGLEARVQPSDAAAERRFIYRAGRLRELHMHPLKFMTSSALPLSARLRVACEPFVKQREEDGDETLASFAGRRLGARARDLLIGPMASGVYAGDPPQMSRTTAVSSRG